MQPIIKKMRKAVFLLVELIVGIVMMAAVIIGIPVSIFSIDASLVRNPYVLGMVIILVLVFGLMAFFGFIRPYVLYRKTPEVQVEADDEFLYIHTKKQAKIPLSSLSEATISVDLPFLLQKEFLADIIIYLFAEEYGNIVIEIPDYGTYKLRFVARAQKKADDLERFFDGTLNGADITMED